MKLMFQSLYNPITFECKQNEILKSAKSKQWRYMAYLLWEICTLAKSRNSLFFVLSQGLFFCPPPPSQLSRVRSFKPQCFTVIPGWKQLEAAWLVPAQALRHELLYKKQSVELAGPFMFYPARGFARRGRPPRQSSGDPFASRPRRTRKSLRTARVAQGPMVCRCYDPSGGGRGGGGGGGGPCRSTGQSVYASETSIHFDWFREVQPLPDTEMNKKKK